jgi:tetratricopeptide (TPR) repeat protein
MPTIKTQVGKSLTLFLAAVTFFTACGPPGPRALLRGRKLLEQGKYAQAEEKFREAVGLLGNTNAQALNYLGLACHHAGQRADAERAYQRSLVLDPDLAEARFNLGCLYLEENQCEQAKAEFTAFTLRRSNVPEGWVQLGTAELRAGEIAPPHARPAELAAAERSFTQALRLSPKDVEALTGMGLVKVRRGNPADAAQWFSKASAEQPEYPPALLNLAIVQQQNLNNPSQALKTYQQYLALKPTPDNAAAVQAVMRQIQVSLQPAPTYTASRPLSPPVLKPEPARPIPAPPARAAVTPAAPVTNSMRLAHSNPAQNEQTPARLETSDVVARSPTTNTSKPAAANPPSVEVVTVPSEAPIQAAQDSAPGSPVSSTLSGTSTPTAGTGADNSAKAQKHGFLHRLNPAVLFSSGADSSPTSPPSLTNASTPAVVQHASAESATAAADLLRIARYHYHSPAKLARGNRAEAERAFAQGVQAQESQRLQEAIQGYRRAAQLDPSFFEVHYNLGRAASEAGNLPLALGAYEDALALRPASLDARYNFALVLKQASYYLDAAQELEKLLTYYPNDSRAHLALGNLLAQQLNEPDKARPHYLKVLESDPRNPQAGAIRYWLTAGQ